jgi:hypothetical protein
MMNHSQENGTDKPSNPDNWNAKHEKMIIGLQQLACQSSEVRNGALTGRVAGPYWQKHSILSPQTVAHG